MIQQQFRLRAARRAKARLKRRKRDDRATHNRIAKEQNRTQTAQALTEGLGDLQDAIERRTLTKPAPASAGFQNVKTNFAQVTQDVDRRPELNGACVLHPQHPLRLLWDSFIGGTVLPIRILCTLTVYRSINIVQCDYGAISNLL